VIRRRFGILSVVLGVLLAAAGSLLLAGCAPKPASKYRIAVIPKGLTHEFWQSIERGARQAAADLGQQGTSVEIIWDGPRNESDDRAQISIVDRQVANRVSGIVLAPQHSVTMVDPVERAVKQNIPVVIIDSGLSRPDLYIKYVATDNANGGRLAAEHLLKILAEEPKPAPRLVMIRYAVGSESTEQREKGFEEFIDRKLAEQKSRGEPTITWLSRDQYAGDTTDSAQKAASPLLNRLRGEGIDGVFAPNESSTAGTLRAMEALKLNRKVRLIGFDSSPPLLQGLKDGDIDGLILQDPYRMGYLGVWTVVQHLEGCDVCPDGKKELSTGEYLVTRATIDQPSTRELFDPELQKKRKIDPPKYPRKP
jgi:ribose transport system substrate-binding protein